MPKSKTNMPPKDERDPLAFQSNETVKLIKIEYVDSMGRPTDCYFRVSLKCYKFLTLMYDRKYYLKSLDVLFNDGTLHTRTDETDAIAVVRGLLTEAEKIYF